MNNHVRIGSRKSKLALVQSNLIKSIIERDTGYSCEIITMDTKGDRILDRSLPAIGDKGLFTRELEDGLLAGRIDIAVHSLKDLPTRLPEGLTLGAITRREDARDAFLSSRYDSFQSLPAGARIATGSLRRRAQVLRIRPDLTIDDLRGNVPTRIEKMNTQNYDGIILAAAGIKRLGLDHVIREYFEPEMMIPAAGQGALGIETRIDTADLDPLLGVLNDSETATATQAERSILHRLDGSCQVPVGVHVTMKGATALISAFVSSLDGTRYLHEHLDGPIDLIETLASSMVSSLISRGALDLIRELKTPEKRDQS